MTAPTSSSGPRRLRIVHRTGFHYDGMVTQSFNEARMTPAGDPRQTVLAAKVTVEPVTWTYSYRDYWGTQVTAFDVAAPHRELTVVSSSTVEVMPAPAPRRGQGWDALRDPDTADKYVEHLVQTPRTQPAEEVALLARERAADLAPDAAAREVVAALRERVDYVPGSTQVHTGATEVWETGSGVCQDFAHLSLGALRSIGVPARYVSGYLHPKEDAGIEETVEGESHAWIEWWAGEWFGFDPTSLRSTGTDHVVVARGRDYTDVTPLKGIYSGAHGSSLFVSVEVTRLV